MPSKKRASTPGPISRSSSTNRVSRTAAESVQPEREGSPRPDLLRRSTSPTDSITSIRSSRRSTDTPPVPPIRPASMRLVTTIPTPTNPNPFASVAPEERPERPEPIRPRTPENPKRQSTGSTATPEHAVINFGRRPSAVDPLSTTPSGGSSTRQLVSATGEPSPPKNRASAAAAAAKEARKSREMVFEKFAPAPPSVPEGGLHQRRRSHTRQGSISLAPSPSTMPAEQVAPRATRAPMEAFASVEMLQGQRQHQDRTRGSEVFGSNGFYEGRASLGEQAGRGTPRRQDPTEGVRSQRQGVAPRQNSGPSPIGASASHFPPLEAAIADIANQLRAVDNGRRESEWRHRLAGDLSEAETEGSSSSGGEGLVTPDFGLNTQFQFPSAKPVKPFLMTATSKFAYESSEGGELGLAFQEKSVFNDAYSTKVLGNKGEWTDESLGQSEKASIDMKRPSIVALPVYPSPSGTTGRSFKTRVKRVASAATWLTVLLAAASTWVYLAQRVRSVQLVEAHMPGVFVGGWAFLALEISVAVIITLSSFWTVYTYRSVASSLKLRLRGDANLPAIDVLIVSSGQADQTVFDCAIAAAAMDYPAHRYRVMVLDAANSPNLQREVQKHIKTQACPHLSYHRRAIGQVEGDLFHSRAAAVAFGLKEASSFGVKGPAEFIVVFEADVIPDRNYLRAVLPTILSDAEVGLVKAPHGFINLPRRVKQSVLTLLQAAETSSENRSGFVVRRSAVTEIGGFPEDSWIPDGQLEALMLGHGYKTETIHEVLQWTMAQPTYGAQVNAMMINALGPLRTASRLGFFVFSGQVKKMPLSKRLTFLGRALTPFFSLFVLAMTIAYPFMLSYGGLLVLTTDLSQLTLLLEAALVMIVLNRLHEIVWCWATGTSSPRRSLQAWIFAAPYHGIALLRLFLPSWMGGYSTGSDMRMNEVEHAVRPSVKRRLGWLIIDPHTGFLSAFLASFGVTIWRLVKEYKTDDASQHQVLLSALLTLAWPSLLWLDFMFASLVPFTCLLFPSLLLTTPREAFVVRDHYSFVARPKQDFKTFAPWKQHRGSEVLVGLLLVVWSAVCVGLATSTDLLV